MYKENARISSSSNSTQKWIFFADHNGTKIYFGGEDIFKNSSAELLNFEFPIHVEKKGGWGSLVH